MLMAAFVTRSRWAVMSLFFAANLVGGVLAPVYMSWFNDEIDEAHRATMLSFGNTFNTMGAAAGLPIGGVIADRFGLAIAWGFGGILSSISAPLYLTLRPRAVASLEEVDEPASALR